MPTPGKSEETDQILFVNWVHCTYPDAWPFLHHSPNGKRRSASDGQKLKLMGVRAGFPDLFLPWPVGDYMGCVIELKLGNEEWKDMNCAITSANNLSELGAQNRTPLRRTVMRSKRREFRAMHR